MGASLLAKHVVALPVSVAGVRLASSVHQLRAPQSAGKWLAVHVLYSECRCSQRVVAHLSSSVRPTGWDEEVLWVGPGALDPVLASRFRVRRLSSVELAHLGIDSAPLMIVASPDDEIRYAGGYSQRKQAPALDDLRILADSRRQVVASLPVFGCAVSERLRRQFAGLGWF